MRLWALFLLGACAAAPVAATRPAVAPTGADPADYAAVHDFLTRKRPQVVMCYATAVENREISDKAQGQVQLWLAVLPSGASEGTRVASSTLKSKSVEDCIVGLVGRWTFPAPRQRIELTYTYELAPL
jgi:hypothetical protein